MYEGLVPIDQTYVDEYMAELNDFLLNSLFKDLTC